jgi:glycerate dehydrogenase
MLNIIITDGYALNPGDLTWDSLKKLGHTTIYDHTPPELLIERAKNAHILLVNKTLVSAEAIQAMPQLRYIGVTATGYNNVDIAAAKAHNIPVCNAVGYSGPSVSQHVFALILALINKIGEHNTSVQAGDWGRQPHFAYWLAPIHELAGKTLGLYGFGNIGKAVAKIGQGFGMKIIVHRRNTEGPPPKGIRYVSLDTLLSESDIISLNAPMTIDNQGLINKNTLKMMKPTTLLINTARGGFIIENDLKEALENKTIAGAALDVLSIEPPTEGSVLMGVPNCIITPHIAWASFESRQRLMKITIDNIKLFLKNTPKNIVNL